VLERLIGVAALLNLRVYSWLFFRSRLLPDSGLL
jgi:hypothetical protein